MEDWTSLSRSRQHREERIVAGIAEKIKRDVDIMARYWHIGGRVAFTRLLDKYELAARYADPAVRAEILADLTEREGPEAAARWMDRAMNAAIEIEQEIVEGS